MTGLRVADAFAGQEDGRQVSDADFLLTCTCGLEQRLDSMQVEDLGELTLYDCSRCENTIVAILTERAATQLWLSASVMARRDQASGYRRDGYVIAARIDLALRPPDADDDVLLIRSSHDLFDALRNI